MGRKKRRRAKKNRKYDPLLTQELVETVRTFGRGGTTDDEVYQLEAVLVDEWEHLLLQLHNERVALGDSVFVDGEDHLTGNIEELLVRQLHRVLIGEETDIRIVVEGGRVRRQEGWGCWIGGGTLRDACGSPQHRQG